MTKTLADYIPMLKSIQSDPENVLDPDYINARITYKNRDLMLMIDSAGVNLELTAPKDYLAPARIPLLLMGNLPTRRA